MLTRACILGSILIAGALGATKPVKPPPLLSAVTNLAAFRSKIESCAHDIQASIPKGSPEAQQAQQLYEAAREAYADYLGATAAAAKKGLGPSTILAFAQKAEALALKFLAYAATILKSIDRSVEAEQQPPMVDFAVRLCERQRRLQPAVARAIQQQLGWAPWQDVP